MPNSLLAISREKLMISFLSDPVLRPSANQLVLHKSLADANAWGFDFRLWYTNAKEVQKEKEKAKPASDDDDDDADGDDDEDNLNLSGSEEGDIGADADDYSKAKKSPRKAKNDVKDEDTNGNDQLCTSLIIRPTY
jgi:hypothetical protein